MSSRCRRSRSPRLHRTAWGSPQHRPLAGRQAGRVQRRLLPAHRRSVQRLARASSSSLPVEAHSILALEGEGRQAQRIEVRRGGEQWTVVNTHLYWNPLHEAVRVRSGAPVARLAGWRQAGRGMRRFQRPPGLAHAQALRRAPHVGAPRPARQGPAAHLPHHVAPRTEPEALGPSRRSPRQRPRAPAPQHALRRRRRLRHDRRGRPGGVVRGPLRAPITTGPENLRLRPLRTFRSPRTP